MTVVLCGIPSEPPLRLVRERLAERGVAHLVFDQRAWQSSSIEVEASAAGVSGTLSTPAATIALEGVTGVMTRLMDEQALPDLAGEPPHSRAREAARALHSAVSQWIEICAGRVLTRARPQSSNAAKPYQAQLIRACGFSVPATLITTEPAEVRDFLTRHGRLVYKSASAVRSIVRELMADDLERLAAIGWCPVQFQELVPGTDVRVHVVGREVFATAVESDGVDYRYATVDGGTTTLRETRLPDQVADACRTLAHRLELPLAGIDLRLADEGRVVCFEVNPSPGYSYYEQHTGQPISAAIAQYLAGG